MRTLLPEESWRARQLLLGVARGKHLDQRDRDLVLTYLQPAAAAGVTRGLLRAEVARRAVATWRYRKHRAFIAQLKAGRGQRARAPVVHKAPKPTKRNWRIVKGANGRYRVT